MKKCGQCKKQLEEHFFIANEKDHKVCNKCREYAKIYYKKERIEKPEKQKARSKKFRAANLEKIKEKDKLAQRKRRLENPEKCLKIRSAYQEKNKGKLKAGDRNRMIDRPEYFLFSSARGRARKNKIEFSITEKDIKNLIDKTIICPLRKTLFERGSKGRASPNSISIDRIDSSRGYTLDNVQIISYKANLIKNSITLKTFNKIVNNLKVTIIDPHAIDDNTRYIIIKDRLKQFKKDSRDERDKHRLLNVETWLLNSAKKRAKYKGLDINIDVDYIKSIWPLDNKCPILKEKFVSGKLIMSKNSATIDRIDNNKGYIKGNIMIVSARVNSVKNNATIEELEFILKNWKVLERKV